MPLLVVAFALAHVGPAIGANLGWSQEIPPRSTGGSEVLAQAVACPSAAQCTAVDTQGQEVTFDPRSPELPQPIKIDWGNALAAIACPSASQCTAVDNEGNQLTFDPAAPGAVSPSPASQVSLIGVACLSAIECVGVGNPQNTAVTFDPLAPTGWKTLAIEERDGLGAVSCPAATQCTATTYGHEVTFNPQTGGGGSGLVPMGSEAEEPLHGVACPSVTQCTVVAFGGDEITFDPSTPSGAKTSPLGISDPWGVACPSAEQCTAVGQFGTSTFDPLESERLPLVRDTGGGFVSSIACPEPTQCTTVAEDEETTFDPQPEPALAETPLPPPPVEASHEAPETIVVKGSPLSALRSQIALAMDATVAVHGDRAEIPARCLGTAPCSVQLALGSDVRAGSIARGAAARTLLIGSARSAIPAGQRAEIAVELTPAGVHLLRTHHGRIAAKLTINGLGGAAVIHATEMLRLSLVAR
jgi:hypothetical protein